MNIEQLKFDLVRDEGFRSCAYQDTMGYWTIGVGRNVDKRGGGISMEEAMVLLDNDIDAVRGQLDAVFPWWTGMSEPRQRVLANMCFELGIGRLKGFTATLLAMQEGRWDDAVDEMKDSKWYNEAKGRADRLVDQMRKG